MKVKKISNLSARSFSLLFGSSYILWVYAKGGNKGKESLPHSYRISYRNEDKRSGKEDDCESRQLHSCVMNVAAWRHTHCGQTIVTAVAYYMAGSNTFLTDSTFASEHFTTFLKIHLNKVLYNAIVWLWI